VTPSAGHPALCRHRPAHTDCAINTNPAGVISGNIAVGRCTARAVLRRRHRPGTTPTAPSRSFTWTGHESGHHDRGLPRRPARKATTISLSIQRPATPAAAPCSTTAGGLPAGLKINTSTGAITGTVAAGARSRAGNLCRHGDSRTTALQRRPGASSLDHQQPDRHHHACRPDQQ